MAKAEQERRKLAAALTMIVNAARAGRIPEKGSYSAPALLSLVGVDPEVYTGGSVKRALQEAGIPCDRSNRFRGAMIHKKAGQIESHAKRMAALRQSSVVEMRLMRRESGEGGIGDESDPATARGSG